MAAKQTSSAHHQLELRPSLPKPFGIKPSFIHIYIRIYIYAYIKHIRCEG